MAVRDDFAAGEVLAAADLNDTFAEKLPYSYGTATPSTSDSGFLWYDSNSTPAATKFWDGSAFVPFGGKILQVVRATDASDRTTNSATYVDASISVTITPQKSTSAILLVWTSIYDCLASGRQVSSQITDSSNNAISGAEEGKLYGQTSRILSSVTIVGYATPATTSATTYKGRFRSTAGGDVRIQNSAKTGQLYAIEVSA